MKSFQIINFLLEDFGYFVWNNFGIIFKEILQIPHNVQHFFLLLYKIPFLNPTKEENLVLRISICSNSKTIRVSIRPYISKQELLLIRIINNFLLLVLRVRRSKIHRQLTLSQRVNEILNQLRNFQTFRFKIPSDQTATNSLQNSKGDFLSSYEHLYNRHNFSNRLRFQLILKSCLHAPLACFENYGGRAKRETNFHNNAYHRVDYTTHVNFQRVFN